MSRKADQTAKALHGDAKNFQVAYDRMLESVVWSAKEKRLHLERLNALINAFRSKSVDVGIASSSDSARRTNGNGSGALRKSA